MEQYLIDKRKKIHKLERRSDELEGVEIPARTAGWSLFDSINYGVINVPLNIGLGCWWADDQMKNDHWREWKNKGSLGKEPPKAKLAWFHDNVTTPVHEKFSVPLWEGVSKNLLPKGKYWNFPSRGDMKFAAKAAGSTTGIIALCWGGHALMIPMKMMEDNRKWLVRKFDNGIDSVRSTFGYTPSQQDLKIRQEVYKKLDSEELSETWGSFIKARLSTVVGASAAMVALVAIDKDRDGIGKIVNWGGDKITEYGKRNNKSWAFIDKNSNEGKRVQGLLWNISAELAVTVLASAAFYMNMKWRDFKTTKLNNNEHLLRKHEAPDTKVDAANSNLVGKESKIKDWASYKEMLEQEKDSNSYNR